MDLRKITLERYSVEYMSDVIEWGHGDRIYYYSGMFIIIVSQRCSSCPYIFLKARKSISKKRGNILRKL